MKDGIYHVRFSSSVGAAGEGLAVVKDGSVNGGDAGYLYLGQLSDAGSGLSGPTTACGGVALGRSNSWR